MSGKYLDRIWDTSWTRRGTNIVSDMCWEIYPNICPKLCPNICPRFCPKLCSKFCPKCCSKFAPNRVPKFALKTFAAARCCYKKILGKPLQNFEQYFGHDLGKARQDFGQHFGHVFGKTRFPSLKLTLSEFCPNFCRGLPTLCPKFCPRLPDSCPNICSSRKTKESKKMFFANFHEF